MTDGARNTIPKGNNSARLCTGFEPLVAQSWVKLSIPQKEIHYDNSNSTTLNIQF
nr:MAG TPA: hypothetical protein [Caudoviricetes sp.]